MIFKVFLFLMVISMSATLGMAQVKYPVGYMGRTFIVKTNGINGRYLMLNNIESELAISSRFSISAGVSHREFTSQQKYNISEYATSFLLSAREPRHVMRNRAQIQSWDANLLFKLYHSSIFSAPRGFYSYQATMFGLFDVEGDYYKSLLTELDYDYGTGQFTPPDEYLEYSLEANALIIELGMGYQEVLMGFLVLDGRIGLSHSTLIGSDAKSRRLLSGVARSYGPNLLWIPKDDGLLRARKPYTTGIGISAYLQIGFLLF